MKTPFIGNFPRKILCLILLFFMGMQYLSGSIGSAVTGIWGQSSTWIIGGVQRVPTCGDTLIIPAGVTVTVDGQEDYQWCSQSMYIEVHGILQLVNGYKIELPCSSSVRIFPGGILKKATPGGGNSTLIQICGCISWNAGQGDVLGPSVLNCSILPVTILSFEAVNTENWVQLKWTTATEVNNDYFTVERSDGNEFYVVGIIKGAGNSTVRREYEFNDPKPIDRIVYYRIKQTDYDGKYSYSDVVALKRNFDYTISVSVMDKKLKLFTEDKIAEGSSINVFSRSGQEIYYHEFKNTQGNNYFETYIRDLTPGFYFLLYFDPRDEQPIHRKIYVGS